MSLAPQLKVLEPRLDVGRRELEVVRQHVAVGARASVAIQVLPAAGRRMRTSRVRRRCTARRRTTFLELPVSPSVRWFGAGEILALLALISIDEQRTSPQAISKDGAFTMSTFL